MLKYTWGFFFHIFGKKIKKITKSYERFWKITIYIYIVRERVRDERKWYDK